MNDYRITRTTGETAAPITAIDEKDARRIFKSRFKGEIATVELIRENVPATKAQELEALEKIKAIVETLGPQSYLATAFEGCFDDAESNIENDFGDSMKARWKSAEQRYGEAVKEAFAVSEELELVQKNLQSAEAALERMQTIILGPDDLEDLRQLVSDRVDESCERAKETAAEIVEYADDPSSTEFLDAVKMNRSYAGRVEFYRNLIGRVEAAQAAARSQDGEEG